MRHFNSLLTKSLFSATLLAMSAAANAQVFEKVAMMHSSKLIEVLQLSPTSTTMA